MRARVSFREKYIMKKLLFGLAALPFLAGIALAGQPLSDQQMDRVIAGITVVSVPLLAPLPTCGPGAACVTTNVVPSPGLPFVFLVAGLPHMAPNLTNVTTGCPGGCAAFWAAQ
jgi:hypothetical protein